MTAFLKEWSCILLLQLQWRLKEGNDYEGGLKKEKWKQGRSSQFFHNANLCKINLEERPALNLFIFVDFLRGFCIGSQSLLGEKLFFSSSYWASLWSRKSHCEVAQGAWMAYCAGQYTNRNQKHIVLNE